MLFDRTGDADMLVNILGQLPELSSVALNIGTNFAPEVRPSLSSGLASDGVERNRLISPPPPCSTLRTSSCARARPCARSC